ncbi:MAG: peptide ABC transporter substrate-binding protein, partial [Rhodospirillales bacterium]|nr:peptide ABC transporter substrate-binding protein [Rhodospirillales bacterium]
NNPLHPYTEALISAIPEPDPNLEFNPSLLKGDMVNLINRQAGCVFVGRCPVATSTCSEIEPTLEAKEGLRSVACHLR